MKNPARIHRLFFFLLLFASALVVTFTYHSRPKLHAWQGIIYADGAGYYSYLPALFLAGLDPAKMPPDCDEKTGYGFTLHPEDKTIRTKYFYGVSLLLTPFFLVTHGIAALAGIPEESGFARIFEYMVQVAAVVYLILGLVLLERILATWFEAKIRFLIVFLLFAGTNLFYYSLMAPAMSHVYSFFLFSLFIYSVQRFQADPRWKWFFPVSLATALSVIIRPTNGLILILFFLWNAGSREELLARIRIFGKPAYLATFLACLFFAALPQLLYWKYAFHSYVVYSYGNEGFSNWDHPWLPAVWFAPKNGLLPYTPLAIFMILGIVLMIRRKMKNGGLILFFFLVVSYLGASWWAWELGCGFGYRAFVEYYVLLAIPMGFLLAGISRHKGWFRKGIVGLILLLFSIVNVATSWSFPNCFHGETWEWKGYLTNMTRTGIFPGEVVLSQIYQPFEKSWRNKPLITDSLSFQGSGCARVTSADEFPGGVTRLMKDFRLAYPTLVRISARILDPDSVPTGARIVCTVDQNDQSVVWQSAEIDSTMIIPREWNLIEAKFRIPDWGWQDAVIKVYIWNEHRTSFFLDDMIVRFCTD